MKKFLGSTVPVFLLLISCQTVPITGRQQLNLVSSDTLHSMSFKSYSEFLAKNKVIKGTEQAAMVKRVGNEVQAAVQQYFAENNLSSRLSGYEWEFNLIEDKTINAWCMPGGKVAVYTGILPVTQDEKGLAVVMAHEIAHAVAQHGNERMSQSLMVEMGAIALSTALSTKPQQTQNLFLSLFGIGSEVGFMLPYSRVQETEADQLGLIFMAMAGYDPNSALGFMERMEKSAKGAAAPEFLSTHPSDSSRIETMKKLIPEAMKYYKVQR